jgi:hypothetical protein
MRLKSNQIAIVFLSVRLSAKLPKGVAPDFRGCGKALVVEGYGL